jgi:hypothetical protein
MALCAQRGKLEDDSVDDLYGVSAPLVDLESRVPTLEAGDFQHRPCRPRRRGFKRGLPCPDGITPARTPHVNVPFLLGIEIHEGPALQHARRQVACARQPGLLIDCEQEFQGTVDERAVLHDREVRRHADAVVRTERRPVGHQHVPFPHQLDGVSCKVVGLVFVLFADHVEMTLERDAPDPFLPCTRRLPDDHVAELVRVRLQAESLCRLQHIFRHRFLMLGAAGDSRYIREVLPHDNGLQPFDRLRHCSMLLSV